MAGGAISWTSKKQPCVALSTTDSEYIAEALASSAIDRDWDFIAYVKKWLLAQSICQDPTAEMAANGLTKPLAKIMFKRFVAQIGLGPSYMVTKEATEVCWSTGLTLHVLKPDLNI
ncbi:hypothetical protein VN97_g8902 [Penicillium thymicola]|uniref:Uncharacterized protein n=1 Tax=Penicillium thymicola TaxID=293382 RepID=A0AAI9TBX6_PENTH|nr:hypothetical protein VN97_g8902 [Penicillium thymicola]